MDIRLRAYEQNKRLVFLAFGQKKTNGIWSKKQFVFCQFFWLWTEFLAKFGIFSCALIFWLLDRKFAGKIG